MNRHRYHGGTLSIAYVRFAPLLFSSVFVLSGEKVPLSIFWNNDTLDNA